MLSTPGKRIRLSLCDWGDFKATWYGKEVATESLKLQINIFFQAPDIELSEMCKHIKAVDVDLQTLLLKRLFVLILLKLY